jgi:general nucleoside transport system ATP-binding protein
MTDSGANIFECNDITVKYGEVVALKDVSVAFERGKIHAVVGQNGAGKTTFARVVAGLVAPTTGSHTINGKSFPMGTVAQARAAGVELVHQSFALPPSFTVAEALQFGAPGGGVYSKRKLEQKWQRHLDSLDVKVSAGQRIRDLPVETQQGVEIARALVTDAKLLILDEPTAVLSPESVVKLFDRVRRLRDLGVTVVLILHKIREVLAVAETVTVLRGGQLIERGVDCSTIDADILSEMIIGPGSEKPTGVTATAPSQPNNKVETILELKDVSTRQDRDGPALVHVDLNIQAGEIVGVAGVEGNGQRTLVRAIADLAELDQGSIHIDHADMSNAPQIKRRKHGLRIIPFERNVEGLSLSASLWENWAMRRVLQKPIFSMLNRTQARAQSAAEFEKWNIHYSKVDQLAGSLSGGNAQKVILARELDADARLILAAQPTRGLDIGATEFVWQALNEARDRGCGILFVSSDLDEIFDLADRVVVFLSGQIVAEFHPPYDIAQVGAAMTGANT